MLNKLTATEEALMDLMWTGGEPMTSVDILREAEDQTWGGNYVHKMLLKLQQKEYIEVCGTVQYGKQYARQFRPLVEKDAYIANLFVEKGVTAKMFPRIVQAFVEREMQNREVGEALIKELQDVLEQAKQGQ